MERDNTILTTLKILKSPNLSLDWMRMLKNVKIKSPMITAQQTIIMTTSERNVDAYHSQSTLTERYRDVINVRLVYELFFS